jgi:uncharacterized membrane protein YdjX (TVP38/TMEM64 family)
MEPDKTFFGSLKSDLLDYGKTRLDLAKLELTEKTARIVAFACLLILMATLFMLVIIFTGITAAYWFAALTGSVLQGYAIVAAILLVLLLVVYLFRHELIEKPVMNRIIRFMNQ